MIKFIVGVVCMLIVIAPTVIGGAFESTRDFGRELSHADIAIIHGGQIATFPDYECVFFADCSPAHHGNAKCDDFYNSDPEVCNNTQEVVYHGNLKFCEYFGPNLGLVCEQVGALSHNCRVTWGCEYDDELGKCVVSDHWITKGYGPTDCTDL